MEDDSDTNSPLASPDSLSDIASPLDSPDIPSSPSTTSRPSAQHAASDRPAPSTANMTTSSTPLGNLNAARNPARPVGGLNPDMLAKMRSFHLSRTGPAPRPGAQPAGPGTPKPSSSGPILSPPAQSPGPGGVPPNFAANLPSRPAVQPVASSPAVPGQKPGLSARRGMALPGGLPGSAPAAAPAGGMKRRGPPGKLSDMNKGADSNGDSKPEPEKPQSQMDKYAEFIDKETGALKFHGKATVDSKGIKFASGKEFNISLDEVDTLDELGKGNYGTVYKVRHSRPKMRRPGQGLAGNKAWGAAGVDGPDPAKDDAPRGGTGVVMAMKEMRLELEDSKFATIIMELDVLHRCASPYIVDFYGAFFQEGAVYICMEFMDGGSIDKIYAGGVPEGVLAKVTLATVQGLKSLKDDHNIIHRDVKPTNILVNTQGQVKICDFGVSGNLVASIAKTNIGCQSYMAPERISGGGVAQAGANPGGGTYSVQSDIWSLGLSIIECALGKYPYSPETYDNIFSQLSAIVDGEPPDLPQDSFSAAAHDFTAGCLNKIPNLRPTYAMLLQHAWLAPLLKPDVISEEDEEAAERGEDFASATVETAHTYYDAEVAEWVQGALERKRDGKLPEVSQPALHKVALDSVGSPTEAMKSVRPVAVDG